MKLDLHVVVLVLQPWPRTGTVVLLCALAAALAAAMPANTAVGSFSILGFFSVIEKEPTKPYHLNHKLLLFYCSGLFWALWALWALFRYAEKMGPISGDER